MDTRECTVTFTEYGDLLKFSCTDVGIPYHFTSGTYHTYRGPVVSNDGTAQIHSSAAPRSEDTYYVKHSGSDSTLEIFKHEKTIIVFVRIQDTTFPPDEFKGDGLVDLSGYPVDPQQT